MVRELLAFGLGAAGAGLAAWWVGLRRVRRQNRSQRKLLQRARRAEKMAELGELTGGLAHEIRNPLSTVKINLQLLAEDIEDMAKQVLPEQQTVAIDDRSQRYQRQLRKLETIARETDRLGETLNDFMRYAGRMELQCSSCNVNELLDDLADFYEPQAINENIQMRLSLSKEAPVCFVDADLLKQAILNLFLNATQAMVDGGELIVRTNIARDMAQIDVIDTGPGIAEDRQQEIFQAYYTSRAGGTGLGLPTCRRIVEEHGGQIELISELGKGSDFRILLPLKKTTN